MFPFLIASFLLIFASEVRNHTLAYSSANFDQWQVELKLLAWEPLQKKDACTSRSPQTSKVQLSAGYMGEALMTSKTFCTLQNMAHGLSKQGMSIFVESEAQWWWQQMQTSSRSMKGSKASWLRYLSPAIFKKPVGLLSPKREKNTWTHGARHCNKNTHDSLVSSNSSYRILAKLLMRRKKRIIGLLPILRKASSGATLQQTVIATLGWSSESSGLLWNTTKKLT